MLGSIPAWSGWRSRRSPRRRARRARRRCRWRMTRRPSRRARRRRSSSGSARCSVRGRPTAASLRPSGPLPRAAFPRSRKPALILRLLLSRAQPYL